jgi:hypothetical protein
MDIMIQYIQGPGDPKEMFNTGLANKFIQYLFAEI